MPDLVAMNATMSQKILAEPAQPLVENGYALRVVHTTGRRSGERRATPLGVVQIDGRLYLISPDRGRAWVRNLDADPACTLAPGSDERTAVPAPPEEAAPAISAYLTAMRVPWALQAFPVGPEASLAEITAHLDTIAVYRLDPR
jgi:deazaflavin-dependent oxidoreductase (nitroreductase family)